MMRPTEGREDEAALSLYWEMVDTGYTNLPRPGSGHETVTFAQRAWEELEDAGITGLPRPSDDEGSLFRFLLAAFAEIT